MVSTMHQQMSAHAQTKLMSAFVNKVLLQLSHTHLFAYCQWLLSHSTRVEWCDRPYGPKNKVFTIWIFTEKFSQPPM